MGLFDGFKKRKKDYKEVAADNIKLSERDMLINKIGSDKIQYICDMYMIKKIIYLLIFNQISFF